MRLRSYGAGRVITAEGDMIWAPRTLTRKYAVVYSPPGAESADLVGHPTTSPYELAFLNALADCGALVVVSDWDDHAYGNQTVRDHIETLRSTNLATIAASGLVGNSSLLDTSKIVLVGFSQGACDCYGYTLDHPTRVAGIATIAGVTDLIGFYTGTYRWGGDAGTANQANIGTAWGVTYPTPLPAGADPYNNAASITCPVLLGYSTADTTITTASQVAMAAALPNGQVRQMSTSSTHSDAEAGDALTSGLAAWVLARASGI